MEVTYTGNPDEELVTQGTVADDVHVEQYRLNQVTPEQIAYFIIGTLGFLGNVFVLVVIFRTPSMRKVVTTFFIMHQSFVDSLAALLLIFNYLPQNATKTRFSQNGWDGFICRIWLNKSTMWSMYMISSLNLMAITLERLVAVWKPLWHKVSFTQAKRIAIVVGIWIVGIIIPFLHGIVDARVSPTGQCFKFGMGGTLGLVVGFIQVGFEFAIPVSTFIFSYGFIAYLLRRQNKTMAQHNTMINAQAGRKVHGGKNVIKTMILVCILFVVCWTPNEVYYCMYLVGAKIRFDSPTYMISVNIVFVNCCCNPFVYIFKYRDFQNGLRKLFALSNAVDSSVASGSAQSVVSN